MMDRCRRHQQSELRTDIVYLATHESTQYIRPYSRVGRRLPAFSTSLGKSLLAERLGMDGPDGLGAHLPEKLVPLTEHTLTDRDALISDLEETRSRGYAIDEEANVPGTTADQGLRCFAFALRFSETPSDAISCSVPIKRLDGRGPDIIEALRRTKSPSSAWRR